MRRALRIKVLGILTVTAALWALPSKAMADPIPLCGGGTDVTTYAQGCSVDGLLFSEFNVIDAGSSTVLVNAVLAQLIGSTVYFTFNPNLTGTDLDDIYFLFKVSTLDGTAKIGGVDLFNGGVGNTSIQESLCAVSWLPTLTCNSFIGAGMVAQSGQWDYDYFDPVSVAYVFKDIQKDGTDVDSHLTLFTQSFHTVPDGGSTLGLLGVGLLGLSTLRRRFGTR